MGWWWWFVDAGAGLLGGFPAAEGGDGLALEAESDAGADGGGDADVGAMRASLKSSLTALHTGAVVLSMPTSTASARTASPTATRSAAASLKTAYMSNSHDDPTSST